jgi:hypothetical protein
VRSVRPRLSSTTAASTFSTPSLASSRFIGTSAGMITSAPASIRRRAATRKRSMSGPGWSKPASTSLKPKPTGSAPMKRSARP